MGLNKKGESSTLVPEELTKIILEILVFLVLIGLAVLLFSSLKKNNEVLTAKSSLEEIQRTVEQMKNEGSQDLLLEGPKNWRIVKPSNDEFTLCFCPIKDYNLETCKTKSGVCGKLKNGLKVENSGCFEISEGCISLSRIPALISISKDNSGKSTISSQKRVELVGLLEKIKNSDALKKFINSPNQDSSKKEFYSYLSSLLVDLSQQADSQIEIHVFLEGLGEIYLYNSGSYAYVGDLAESLKENFSIDNKKVAIQIDQYVNLRVRPQARTGV